MSKIKKILKDNAEHLLLLLESQFTQIPTGSCSCHKPIVFRKNRKSYKCDECGEKYKLVVEIVKVNKLSKIDSLFQFREHRGGLDESMKTLVTLSSRQDLIDHCKSILHRSIDSSYLKIRKYSGPDDRIGWDDTFIVTIDSLGVVGFTDKMC